MLKAWRLGASEHWRGPRAHLVIVSIFCFLFLLEYMFNARARDLSGLSAEKFI